MDANFDILPKKVQEILPYMKAQKWLSSYATKDGIHKVLKGVNKRTNGNSQMDLAITDLDLHYNELEKSFILFFKDLQEICNDYLNENESHQEIYQTERLVIRHLEIADINPFHEMHKNINVMKYTDSGIKTYDEDVLDLAHCIKSYTKTDNRFWIWAVERKEDNQFLGTVALIEYNATHNEVGFRFLEKYWNNGYGFETLQGLLAYAKKQNHTQLFAEVFAKNRASEKILRKLNFQLMEETIHEETNLVDRLFSINL